jgi:hypothetical protein
MDQSHLFRQFMYLLMTRLTPQPALERRRSWARVGIGLGIAHIALVVTVILLNLDRLSRLIDALRAMSDLR